MVATMAEKEEANPPRRSYKMGFVPDEALAERILNHLYWTPGASLQEFLEEAARREIDRQERQHHDGKPWPPRKGRLKPGRRIKE